MLQLISIFRLHGLDNLASGTLEIHVKNDNREIVSELFKNLDADDLNIRKGVAGSLKSLNSSSRNHVSKLVEVFNSPKNSTLRSDIALIFVNLGSYAIDAAPTIIKGAQDNDEYVRLLCVIALGNLGLDYPSSIPALKKALYDSSCGVRLNAMEGLQKIGTQEAMSAVEQFRASERYCEMGDV